jgi:spore germination protein YaaH
LKEYRARRTILQQDIGPDRQSYLRECSCCLVYHPTMRNFVLGLLLLCSAALGAQPKSLFYMTDGAESVRSFFAHSGKIDLLVPTWYSVDENGLVSGAAQPAVLKRAHDTGLPVMPIVALFSKPQFHKLAVNVEAQDRMNQAMVRESRANGYIGFQFDLENLDYLDRDNLSALVARSAAVLHKAGLQISIATVPNAPGYPGRGGFSKWIFTDWRGAYDLKALAQSVDLLCLMTYDQNTRWTMPGPVAGWQWTIDNLDYALQFVPKEKLSLGIPLYGYHWSAGAPTVDKTSGEEKPNPQGEFIGAADILQLSTAYSGRIQWDETERTAFVYFTRDQLREWIFFTDQRTFKERYQLAADRHIEGFCSWALGTEDESIWALLPDRKPAR